MASLHRIASLADKSEPCPSLNAGHCAHRLIRHSSLPNLFLGQPELSMKADHGLRPRNHDCKRSLSHSVSSSNSRTLSRSSNKLALCRALSIDSFDELSCFDQIPTANASGRFSSHAIILGASDSCGSERFPARVQAKLFAAGKKSTVDVEKSIVYNELKNSLWKFEAPPRSLNPIPVETRAAYAGINSHTHSRDIHHEASMAETQDICGDGARIDVKERPVSLRMLKRKFSKVNNPSKASFRRQLNQNCPPQNAVPINGFMDPGDSVSSAFSSLFGIMEMLQQSAHSLCMRSRPPIFKAEYESCLGNSGIGRTCPDTLESFLWLFQQVFSCTPRLMILTMLLIADFALHSVSTLHVAFPVITALGEPPTSTHFPSHHREGSQAPDCAAPHLPRSENTQKIAITQSNIDAKVEQCNSHVILAGNDACGGPGSFTDKKTRHGGMFSDQVDPRPPQLRDGGESRGREKPLISKFLSGHKAMDLDGPTKRMLVAPVQAPVLEADDYSCFDLTDLAYQRAITADPTNPLLLANYAQFLHLVRRDHNRAEELYKKAVQAEVDVDGELMGKFASFLWVAKGDVAEAERAYKAAAMADPSNAFHAGNYAHFLWNSSVQSEEIPTHCFDNGMNTSY